MGSYIGWASQDIVFTVAGHVGTEGSLSAKPRRVPPLERGPDTESLWQSLHCALSCSLQLSVAEWMRAALLVLYRACS